jgi:CRISPR system Cascade subunit CasE
MYLSRVGIKLCEESLKYLDALVKNEGYAAHQLLWSLFPKDPEAQRDFLFRAEKKEGWPLFYLLSKRPPEGSSNIFSIKTKPYKPKVIAGERFAFDIRANPVVAKREEGKKNSKHHDVWMDAKNTAKLKKLNIEETEALIQEYTANWLLDRAVKNGFKVTPDELRIDAYRQNRVLKKGLQDLRYSTVDYKGTLIVTDAEKFIKTLFEGIGRAKAFGCGLMLVKPV